MARDYTVVRVTIWNDPDFVARSTDAQWLYFALLTHPLIDSCGVVPWREAHLIKRSAGMTVERLRTAACELADAGLVAVDPDTEEALVRSFVRHDGVLKSPNMTKALVREHGAIASLTIKALVSREVRRATREHPEWKGIGVAEPVAKQFPEADEQALPMVPEGFRKGSDSVPEGFEAGSDSVRSETPSKRGKGSDSVPLSLTPNPQPLGDESPRTTGGASAPRRKPERPIPDDWQPNARHTEWAHEHGVAVTPEAERFRDWHQAHDSRMRDWDAAFRTWLHKAAERQPARRGAQGAPGALSDIPGWLLR